jgi:hypothetical protein
MAAPVNGHEMKHLALTRRTLLYVAFAAVATLFAALGAIQLQQRIFRHRAEQLLADVQSLKLRETTFGEAQGLFRSWKDFGKYDGECTEKHCEFQIIMETFVESQQFRFFGRQWLQNDYVRLGARPAQLFARIGVENGIVWGKAFDLHVGIPYTDPEDGYFLINLMGHSGTVSRFASRRPDYTWNTDYVIGSPSGCEGCIELSAKFTPYADPRLVQRLMDINLSCLGPWSTCRERKDIMPAAWNQFYEDSAAHPHPLYEPDCNEKTVVFLARDAQSAAIVEVLAIRREKGDYGRDILFPTVRLLTPLKRIIGWDVGAKREIMITDKSVALAKTNPLSEVRPGRRFIHLFTSPDMEEPCAAVPLTPHNLDLVRRGIALDYLAPYPELEIQNLML